MSAARLEQQPGGQWRISGELSFSTVPGLNERLAELFADQQPVHIDLGNVERADSAGVALLVEWTGEAARRQVEIRYLNVPPQMLAIVRVSSLDQILPLARA